MLTRSFDFEGHRLVYDEYGKGDKVVVLTPGLLFSRKMHQPLAEQLADGGHRVLCLDVLGHGDSDRPEELWNYNMSIFGLQTIALLDHAGVDKAVVGGTSLGANTTLEAAAAAPERVSGMLIEMPVLDNALLGCAIAFTPLLVGLTFGAPFARLIAAGARLVPRGSSHLGDMLLDWMSQDPKPSASVAMSCTKEPSPFGRTRTSPTSSPRTPPRRSLTGCCSPVAARCRRSTARPAPWTSPPSTTPRVPLLRCLRHASPSTQR